MLSLRKGLSILTLAVVATIASSQQVYYPPAIGDFGAPDRLSRSSDLTGNTDSKSGIFSAWFRLDGGDGVALPFLDNTDNRIYIARNTGNKILMKFRDSTGVTILDRYSSTTYTADGVWRHVLLSWDAEGGLASNQHMYVDDVNVKGTGSAGDDAIDYTQTTWGVAGNAAGSAFFDGALAEVYFAPGQYLDFSIAVNRREFIDADGYPVDLGASCYKPTGTAPLVCMKTQFNNAGENSGTGGNFVINGAPTYTVGPRPMRAPTYTNVPATGTVALGDFNGTSDRLGRTSDLVGDADSKVGIFSVWLRLDGGDGVALPLLGNGSDRIYIERTVGNQFRMRMRNSAGTLILSRNSLEPHTASGIWENLLLSWDLEGADSAKQHMYVNDLSEIAPGSPTDDAIDYTQATWGIAGNAAGTLFFNGAIDELYFNTTAYFDFSVEANRRRFISSTGYPVNLGPSGYKPTGTAPIVYLRTPYNNAGLNSGTGGDFVINGAPVWTTGPVPIILGFGIAGGRGLGVGGRRH